MYDKVKYLGQTLLEWRTMLKGQYSLGELYQMMKRGRDFGRLLSGVRFGGQNMESPVQLSPSTKLKGVNNG